MATLPSARPARKKRAPSKKPCAMQKLAQEHGPRAIETLADILINGNTDTARMAAAKELLDRGYGKSTSTKETETPETPPALPPQLIIQSVPYTPRPTNA